MPRLLSVLRDRGANLSARRRDSRGYWLLNVYINKIRQLAARRAFSTTLFRRFSKWPFRWGRRADNPDEPQKGTPRRQGPLSQALAVLTFSIPLKCRSDLRWADEAVQRSLSAP